MSTQRDLDQLYQQEIRVLSREDRLRLLARIADDLAADQEPALPPAEASPAGGASARAAGTDEDEVLNILDLEGVGAEIWQGTDASAYLDALRDEWDHDPPR